MEQITCRVCGKVCEIVEKEDDDFVCSTCCDLGITDKVELRQFLEENRSTIPRGAIRKFEKLLVKKLDLKDEIARKRFSDIVPVTRRMNDREMIEYLTKKGYFVFSEREIKELLNLRERKVSREELEKMASGEWLKEQDWKRADEVRKK